MTTQYKRILLKLSGESLMGNDPFGINRDTIMTIVRQVKEIADLGVQALWWAAATSFAAYPPKQAAWIEPPPTTWA